MSAVANELRVFDHFVGLLLKGLKADFSEAYSVPYQTFTMYDFCMFGDSFTK